MRLNRPFLWRRNAREPHGIDQFPIDRLQFGVAVPVPKDERAIVAIAEADDLIENHGTGWLPDPRRSLHRRKCRLLRQVAKRTDRIERHMEKVGSSRLREGTVLPMEVAREFMAPGGTFLVGKDRKI